MSSHRSTVRTRFAPSPTGYLHVGTARTALYNYLFARRHAGTFVLRVEDTDVARNVEGGADEIAGMLRWLGLEWDEGYEVGGPHGPYVQSERLDRYHTAVNALIAQGGAYPCYCTPEELEQRRRAASHPATTDTAATSPRASSMRTRRRAARRRCASACPTTARQWSRT